MNCSYRFLRARFLAPTVLLIVLAMAYPLSPSHAQSRPPISQRVDSLLATMTLEQKVGQLFLVSFRGPTLSRSLKRMIAESHIGGIVLFNSAGNIQSTRQTHKLIADAQAEATRTGAKIPLFVAVDEEGGSVTRLPRDATWFPSQMALGATGSTDYARAMARVLAAEMKALGINMVLAPVLDVNDNVLNPVISTRAFSASPQLVSLLGSAMIGEYKRQNIIAVAKHFPGHGGASLDSHADLPIVIRSLNDVLRIDMFPFTEALKVGVDAIMTAHVVYPALDGSAPATLSPKTLQDVLRGQLNYQGLVVSDSLLMRALTKDRTLNQITVEAFKAGVDVLAIGADAGYTRLDRRTTYQALLDAVKGDVALQQKLDASVRRILTVKAVYGILDGQIDPFNANAFGKPENRGIARQIAQASVTLVRNGNKLVPLPADAATLLVLVGAQNTVIAPLRACKPKITVVRARLRPTQGEINTIVRRAKQADVVVVATLNALDNTGQGALVNALADRPVVAVALESPFDILAYANVATYVTTYGDNPITLEALADVLCGKSAPIGVLPVPIGP
jgi:beta-N-acetylhexosaminidase